MGKPVLRVAKDTTIRAVDEPTYVRIKGLDFQDGIIEVKGKEAKLFLNNSQYPVLLVKDLKLGEKVSGGIGLWVDVGTEGYFRDLKVIKQ